LVFNFANMEWGKNVTGEWPQPLRDLYGPHTPGRFEWKKSSGNENNSLERFRRQPVEVKERIWFWWGIQKIRSQPQSKKSKGQTWYMQWVGRVPSPNREHNESEEGETPIGG